MVTIKYVIIKIYCKRRLKIQDLHSVLTLRLQRAHYVPTAAYKASQHFHSFPTARCACFRFCCVATESDSRD